MIADETPSIGAVAIILLMLAAAVFAMALVGSSFGIFIERCIHRWYDYRDRRRRE